MKCVSSLPVLCLLVLSVSTIFNPITPHEPIFKGEAVPQKNVEFFSSLWNESFNLLLTSFLKTLKGVISFSKEQITSSLPYLWISRKGGIVKILFVSHIIVFVLKYILKSIEPLLAFKKVRKDRIRCPQNRNRPTLMNP